MELSATGRNAACDGLVDILNSGTIVFETSGNAEVATVTLGSPAFGDAAAGVATANAITDDTNTNAGTVDHAHLKNSGGTVVADLTVSTSGADVNLTSLTFAAGETLSVTSATITMPAS